MRKYAIWNRKDSVITPIGEVLTAEEWIKRHPIAGIPTLVPVVAAGEINGAYLGTLGEMVRHAESNGWDFSGCTTDEAKLEAYEAFEDSMNTPSNTVSNEELTATSLASIAASMEYQNMMTLPDEEV